VAGLDANSSVSFVSTPLEELGGADAACVYHADDYL
jgi:hypothetical protein